MGVCVCVYLLIPAVLNATKWILLDAVNMLSTLLCLLGVCVCVCDKYIHVTIFSGITPSSWRQGEALIRQFLGPIKNVNEPHSPPTRDTLTDNTPADSQSRTSADLHPSLASAATSQAQDSGVLPDELEHNNVDILYEPEAEASFRVECPSNDAGEINYSKDNADASLVQHQQLTTAANVSDLSIEQPAVHHVGIKLPGSFAVFCACIGEC